MMSSYSSSPFGYFISLNKRKILKTTTYCFFLFKLGNVSTEVCLQCIEKCIRLRLPINMTVFRASKFQIISSIMV